MGRQAESTVVEGSRRCTHCGRVKPLDAFYRIRCRDRHASWCKVCVRIGVGRRAETDDYRAWLADYLARPDVQERRREADLRRRDERKPRQRAYRQTPRAKLLHCRRQARIRLAAATDADRVRRLEELIAAYTREIDRLSAQ